MRNRNVITKAKAPFRLPSKPRIAAAEYIIIIYEIQTGASKSLFCNICTQTCQEAHKFSHINLNFCNIMPR